MTAKLRALHLPDWREGNPYQRLLADGLQSHGVSVTFAQFGSGPWRLVRSWWRAGRPQVVHLHWVNELIGPAVWPRHAAFRAVRRALLKAEILALRVAGTRVVWTIHNLVAHESAHREQELAARAALAAVVSGLIVHSEGAQRQTLAAYDAMHWRRELISVIPHGNYDGCYAPDLAQRDDLAQRWGLDGDTTTILFFGAIRPYKGLESLLRAFQASHRADLRLVVAGHPANEVIRAMVEDAAAQDRRIFPLLQFVPEAAVAPLFDLADVVVIPFERALTSGSAVLAMTFGKALVLPRFARELAFAADEGCVYFDGEAELVKALEGLSRERLHEMGRANRLLADQRAWSAVAARTLAVYRIRAAVSHGSGSGASVSGGR